jgi:hypothetical protein
MQKLCGLFLASVMCAGGAQAAPLTVNMPTIRVNPQARPGLNVSPTVRSGAGAGKVSAGGFQIKKSMDKASPKLYPTEPCKGSLCSGGTRRQ